MKLKNVTANHRANDVICAENGDQTLTGRFMYGPLDMVALTGERVDVHLQSAPPSGDWIYYGTVITDNTGRLAYTLPEEKRLPQVSQRNYHPWERSSYEMGLSCLILRSSVCREGIPAWPAWVLA